MRIQVKEPWWRRILIKAGLAKQRYRPATINDLMYGDQSQMPRQFQGLQGCVQKEGWHD